MPKLLIFSKIKVDYDTWNDAVGSLNHSKFRKFSDYQMESKLPEGSEMLWLLASTDLTSIDAVNINWKLSLILIV